MKKDQADEFEQELMQPLAQALRTRLGDAGDSWLRHLTSGALRRAGFETFYPARRRGAAADRVVAS